jgi:hypothetical protein
MVAGKALMRDALWTEIGDSYTFGEYHRCGC